MTSIIFKKWARAIGLFFILPVAIFNISFRSFKLITNKDLNEWPSLTRCPLCNNRIWIWQRFETRSYKLDVGPLASDKTNLAIKAYLTALVHKGCYGVPQLEPVKFKTEDKTGLRI